MGIQVVEHKYDIPDNQYLTKVFNNPRPSGLNGCFNFTFFCSEGNPCFPSNACIYVSVSADGANYYPVGTVTVQEPSAMAPDNREQCSLHTPVSYNNFYASFIRFTLTPIATATEADVKPAKILCRHYIQG